MGRGVAWTATTEARLKADLAAGLGTAAIANKHCWNKVSVQRAIRKVRSGASLLTKGRRSKKITETASDYIKEMSEKDKSQHPFSWIRIRCEWPHKNVDFLVFLRVLRQIVLFGFLLQVTDLFCCVK